MQIFDVIIFFEQRTIQQKTVKSTYLCLLGARKLAEGKGHGLSRDETEWPRLACVPPQTTLIVLFFTSHLLLQLLCYHALM